MPSFLASSFWAFSSCGTNSCSGGSKRRMVTGRPFMALKMPSKSLRWYGRSFLRAFSRPARSSARIISRMASMRSPSKNICSVRVRPIALGAESTGHGGIVRRIGIGADADLAEIVRPAHEFLILLEEFGFRRLQLAALNLQDFAVLGGQLADNDFAGWCRRSR